MPPPRPSCPPPGCPVDDVARLAALARTVAAAVQPGMTVGLGTGSTADAVIRELGRRVRDGLALRGVPTSRRTAKLARELGIRLVSLEEVDRIDLGIDGADEIDPALNATKGRGGALLHEKLVALACADYVLVAAAEKLVPRLGSRLPLPVEVVPFGWQHTAARLERLGIRPALRPEPDHPSGPFHSDGGHVILDCDIGPLAEPEALATGIKAVAGVVDHGLFLGIAHRAYIAETDGSVREIARPTTPGR
ncbi:MAG: ribose-5-phosphate isomerase RpiA [Chloroflexia bacterium]|nr:ribose-5-phosphate isomerase RpiA [Chloroflexia bacterium]